MVAESEVPVGTAEPVLFPGASVVPKGTRCFDHPDFPSVKTLGYFQRTQDAKYGRITPRVFKNRATTESTEVSSCGPSFPLWLRRLLAHRGFSFEIAALPCLILGRYLLVKLLV